MITITAYKWVPPMVQGLVRDLRVRWALEEAGIAYDVKLVALGPEQASPEYRAWQPFGQVPAYEEGGHKLFESGAIVLHVAEKSEKLMPRDLRDDVVQWLFAAINTIEVPIMFVHQLKFAGMMDGPLPEKTMQWVEKRLDEVATAMKGRDYIAADRFTAADIMMTTVLNQLRLFDLPHKNEALAAYQVRCTGRPAYKKALADQMAAFAEHTPG